MALDRTWYDTLIDDDGSGTTGSIIDKADIDALMDAVDAEIANGGALSDGSNYINDTANAFMTVGLTINQGAADNEALALKSSDVAQPMTGLTEADTYGTFAKDSPGGGGLLITGYRDPVGTLARALVLSGRLGEVADTAKSTSGYGVVSIVAAVTNGGSSVTAVGANGNLVSFENNGAVRFILDADGDSHQDVGTAWTNFDTHDDIAVLNLLTAYVTHPKDPLRATFTYWLLQSRETLERLRLVTFNDDGHHFVNMSRLIMLLVGAVRQLGAAMQQRDERMDQLEQRLLALGA